MSQRMILIACLCMFPMTAARNASAAYQVEVLAARDGETFGRANGINGTGLAVGVSGPAAVRWDVGGQPTRLPDAAGASVSEAVGINKFGKAVGFSYGFTYPPNAPGPSKVAVLWDDLTSVRLLTTPDGSSSQANGIDDSFGRAVGEVRPNVGIRAVRWDVMNGPAVDLAGGPNAYAYAINDHGDAVGVSGGQEQAVLWLNGPERPIPALPLPLYPSTSFCAAYGINGGRQVAGRSGSRAVRWDYREGQASAVVLLEHFENETFSRAFAIDRFGRAVGHSGDHAVFWDDTGSESEAAILLPMPDGYQLAQATSIADGVIAGLAYDPTSGRVDAVRWTEPRPVPEDTGGPVATTGGEADPVTTDAEGDGVSEEDPVETTIVLPSAGSASITENAPAESGAAGYEFLGQEVVITAAVEGGTVTPDAPLRFTFELDGSVVPSGHDADDIAVFRNGVLVEDCVSIAPAGPFADPNPCVWLRETFLEGSAVARVALTSLTTAASTWNFGVEAPTAFAGFREPVNASPAVNVGKAGRTYPVKWRVIDSTGAFVGSPEMVTSVRSRAVNCGELTGQADALEVTTAGGTSLRYEDDQFVLNWQTPKQPGCHVLSIGLTDGSAFSALFRLK